jgi:hypothetical protein
MRLVKHARRAECLLSTQSGRNRPKADIANVASASAETERNDHSKTDNNHGGGGHHACNAETKYQSE